MKVYPVSGHIKSHFYCFHVVACSECGYPHYYPKYGRIQDRFDGRKFKYVCHKQEAHNDS
jgi:hypothetical protein